MAIKKSELYSSLWKSCDELRGGMDPSQYKDYILVLLFIKYVSDKYGGQPDALIVVPKGGSFTDMVALKGDKEIGDKMNKIIGKLAEANNQLMGVINQTDFNNAEKLGSGKAMVDRLTNLISIFQNPSLDFSRNRAEGDDLLGDAFEYLMRNFATESGKSKGQFYTPAEVSRVIAKVIGIHHATTQSQTIYDPTCGSGSLLLKAHDEAPVDVTIYGQEMDVATTALAKMNMILHNCPTAEIAPGGYSSIAAPLFKDSKNTNDLKTFDFVVANPPFSNKAWTTGIDPTKDEYNRFEYGIPPAKNGDYAFLLHILKSMKSTGKGAIILPHGVLFRGNVEADIRINLIKRGVIKGIISLPPNLFYGTGIPACIVLLDKEYAATRKGIFMIDASKGFIKDGNKNRLRHQDIHRIVDTFNKQIETDKKYARMVPLSEIADKKNDYNLNIPRYIDSTEPEDLQDIEGHLKGGIPNRDIEALAPYWKVCPALKDKLFCPGEREGYSLVKVETAQIKPTIFSHPEFVTFTRQVNTLFDKWRTQNIELLKAIKPGDRPKALVGTISENLLAVFANVPLINKYDVYQHLMTYWALTMQDDVYIIVSDGWKGANKIRLIIEDKDKKGKDKEKPDFVVGKQKYRTDLIPPTLVIARYFSDERTAIDRMESDVATITQAMEEMKEEHGGEEGLLADVIDDKGKITKTAITIRLKEIKNDREFADEHKVLNEYLSLIETESVASKKVHEAQKALDISVLSKYPTLSEVEIKTLVVGDKWLATLATDVQSELDRVSQALTGRVKKLAERYATPLPKLIDEVETISSKVEGHLKKMGFAWK
jgi:type I restriction enzyme M protein